jgi:ParB-like chromosome segregation protein Spo0J
VKNPNAQTKTLDVPPEERIGNYRVHPVAAMFPLLEGEEFEAFKTSIRERGQDEPIVIKGDLLIDGRNRLRACLDLAIEPKTREFAESDAAIGDYVLAANIHRRHLSDQRRLMITTKAKRWIIAQNNLAKQAQGRKEGGREGGRGHKKPLLRNQSQGFNEPKSRARNARTTEGQIAELAKCGRHKAAQAIRLVDQGSTELIKQVEKDQISLSKAVKQLAAQDKPPCAESKMFASPWPPPKKLKRALEIEAGWVRCAAMIQPLTAEQIIGQFQDKVPTTRSGIVSTISHYIDRMLIARWLQVETVTSGVKEEQLKYNVTIDQGRKNALDQCRASGPLGESQTAFLERIRSFAFNALKQNEAIGKRVWIVENSSKFVLAQALNDVLNQINQRLSWMQAELPPNRGQSEDKREDATNRPAKGERVN